jgi:hypothetical protein
MLQPCASALVGLPTSCITSGLCRHYIRHQDQRDFRKARGVPDLANIEQNIHNFLYAQVFPYQKFSQCVTLPVTLLT